VEDELTALKRGLLPEGRARSGEAAAVARPLFNEVVRGADAALDAELEVLRKRARA